MVGQREVMSEAPTEEGQKPRTVREFYKRIEQERKRDRQLISAVEQAIQGTMLSPSRNAWRRSRCAYYSRK